MFKTVGLLTLLIGIAVTGVFVTAESPSTARAPATASAPATATSPSTAPATSPTAPLAKEILLDLGDDVALKLKLIPPGKFLMGSAKNEGDRGDDERVFPGRRVNGAPQPRVTISKPFYLGVYAVTVDQYAQFAKETGQKHEAPSFKQTGDDPVVNVSWEDSHAYCAWLSKKTGQTVVLPTEAQWEYACRAGTQATFSFGDNPEDTRLYAWCRSHEALRVGPNDDPPPTSTHPVGQKKPNRWGLYDMHGNAWEWCADYYAAGYADAEETDPTGPKEGTLRVLRGGSWRSSWSSCRCASRNWTSPRLHYDDVGFRVAVVTAGAE